MTLPRLGGHPTAVRHWGHGPRQALALHCSLAHSSAWAGLAAALPEWRVTAPDLPGHGRSAPWDGGEGLHDVATRMGQALIEATGEPVDLIGHSFGATIALRLALEHPESVRRLVLIEPVLFSITRGSAEFDAFASGYAAVDAATDATPAEAAALFHGVWGVGDFVALPKMQQHYMIERMPLVRAQNPVLLDDAPGLVAPERLEGLGLPVLLMEGADSPPIIAAIHDRLAARLPGSRRHIQPGAGHMLPITHAAEVGVVVRDFLM